MFYPFSMELPRVQKKMQQANVSHAKTFHEKGLMQFFHHHETFSMHFFHLENGDKKIARHMLWWLSANKKMRVIPVSLFESVKT